MQQTSTALSTLAGKKIFFGHQSVGFNLIEGVNEIAKQAPSHKLNIIETTSASAFDNPILGHARVGKNTDPHSKLSDFQRIMDSGVGDKVDIAFIKFCYVDITVKSDLKRIFNEYSNTMSRLKQKYPKVIIVHVTVPLTAIKKDLKTKIKAITSFGTPAEYNDNIKRNEFNALLLKEYKGREPVFDLATFEATAPDGTLESFSADGNTYLALYSAYSNDGGHLNVPSRERIAELLLTFLAAL